MLWIVFALMTAVAVCALLLPLRRRAASSQPRAAYDLEIYRDQLAEVERDLARGLIGAAEAKAARAEIGRRALAASTVDESSPRGAPRRPAWALALGSAAVAPLIAVLLYVRMGSPDLPGQPLAARLADARVETTKRDEELLAQLEARLRERSDDLQGWQLLARSYTTLGRAEDAVAAWRQVRRLAPDRPEFAGALGEALVQAAGGTVVPEALALFESVTQFDPSDPRARFYIGIAFAQSGDPRAALQAWTDLAAISPPDAPWLQAVRAQITRVGLEAKIDPKSLSPSAEAKAIAERNAARPPGEAEAIARMPDGEREQMIRGMVDSLAARLESQPDDLEGWRRLGRARRVLGERDKSIDAYAKAATLAPDNVEVLSDYAGALFERVPRAERLSADFVAVMRRILDLDPNHGDALWFVGLAEAEAGRRAAAVALWQRLVERLPAGSQERQEVQTRIERLKQAP